MPAKTVKQRRMMGIAEHHPEKLYSRNRGVLKMGKKKLHEFASTKEKGLPKKSRYHNPGHSPMGSEVHDCAKERQRQMKRMQKR